MLATSAPSIPATFGRGALERGHWEGEHWKGGGGDVRGGGDIGIGAHWKEGALEGDVHARATLPMPTQDAKANRVYRTGSDHWDSFPKAVCKRNDLHDRAREVSCPPGLKRQVAVLGDTWFRSQAESGLV